MFAQTEDLDVLPQLLQRKCEVASHDEQVVDRRPVTAGDDLDAEDVHVMGGEAARDERQAAGLVGQRQPDELWLLAIDRVLEHLSASPWACVPTTRSSPQGRAKPRRRGCASSAGLCTGGLFEASTACRGPGSAIPSNE